ncbi:hypothetical protein HMPREF0670_01893 [Prevotella sp. oral taxon 317 str. F0108]|nr:hypothetical protein HMPREF0670_01893 [Prevotella sp. oral taxon 317 str. F0108]
MGLAYTAPQGNFLHLDCTLSIAKLIHFQHFCVHLHKRQT